MEKVYENFDPKRTCQKCGAQNVPCSRCRILDGLWACADCYIETQARASATRDFCCGTGGGERIIRSTKPLS